MNIKIGAFPSDPARKIGSAKEFKAACNRILERSGPVVTGMFRRRMDRIRAKRANNNPNTSL